MYEALISGNFEVMLNKICDPTASLAATRTVCLPSNQQNLLTLCLSDSKNLAIQMTQANNDFPSSCSESYYVTRTVFLLSNQQNLSTLPRKCDRILRSLTL